MSKTMLMHKITSVAVSAPVHLVTGEATQTMNVYGLETITLGWYTLSNYNYVKTMFECFAAPNIRQENMEVSLL